MTKDELKIIQYNLDKVLIDVKTIQQDVNAISRNINTLKNSVIVSNPVKVNPFRGYGKINQ